MKTAVVEQAVVAVTIIITTTVRAMNVKYKKWRLGGGPVTPKPLNHFHRTLHQ